MMKKHIALLILFAMLFSFVSCDLLPSEDSSAPTDDTAPVEGTETDIVTEPAETEPIETEPVETEKLTVVSRLPSFPDGQFVWNEEQLPTIKSIKIGPNTFSNPDPTEEELSNFLCEAAYYWFSFYVAGDSYCTPYRIPLDNTVTRIGDDDREYKPLDRSYIKNRQFIESIVLESYFERTSQLHFEYFLANDFIGLSDDMLDDIWLISRLADVYITDWDPSLINFVVTEKTDDAMSIHAYIPRESGYTNDGEEKSTSSISELDISMVYTADGLWKINKNMGPVNTQVILKAPARDDFGKRLTIEKAD